MRQIGRPPYNIDVSCSKGGTLTDLTGGFNFIVMLNAFTYGFQEVSDLTINRSHEPIHEGGVSHGTFVTLQGEGLSTMTFKRGVKLNTSSGTIAAAARALLGWVPNNMFRKAALLGIASADAGEALQSGPAVGYIQVFDRWFKNDIITFTFFSLGMVEWHLSTLDAQSGAPLIEDITIAHTGLRRMTTSLVPNYILPGIIQRFKDNDETGYYYIQTGGMGLDKTVSTTAVTGSSQSTTESGETAPEQTSPAEEAISDADTAAELAEQARQKALEAQAEKLKQAKKEMDEMWAASIEMHKADAELRKQLAETAQAKQEATSKEFAEASKFLEDDAELRKQLAETARAKQEAASKEFAEASKFLEDDAKLRKELSDLAVETREAAAKAMESASKLDTDNPGDSNAKDKAMEAAADAENAADELGNS